MVTRTRAALLVLMQMFFMVAFSTSKVTGTPLSSGDDVHDAVSSWKDESQGDYLISAAVMTQYEATAYCYNTGLRRLASIESFVEHLEVSTFMQSTSFGGFGWTSGSADNWIDDTYKWMSTDEIALFTQFEAEFPQTGLSWGEWKMRGILIGNGSYWQLERKLNQHHAICEL